MDRMKPLAVGCLLVATEALAGSIYRCDTAEGVVFSQSPCAEDAVRLDGKRARSEQARTAPDPEPARELVDISEPGSLGHGSVGEIVARLGQPAAKYTKDGTEHWFYPNAVDGSGGERKFAEMLIEDGRMFQITWLPEDVMKRSVVSARRIGDWKQPDRVNEKRFTVADTNVVGDDKATVKSKLGEPDAKKVFDGAELWEYRKVRITPGKPETLTIYLEFEGDKVIGSVGN